MELACLKILTFLSLILFGGVARNEAAPRTDPLLVENGTFKVSQIKATNITDIKILARLQKGCCENNLESESGLCLSPTGKPTIEIEFQHKTKVSAIEIQAPGNCTKSCHGFLDGFKIIYKEKRKATNQTVYGKDENHVWGFNDPHYGYVSQTFPIKTNPVIEKLIIQIESHGGKQPCLRMEVLGCLEKDCPVMWKSPTVDAVDTGNGDNTVEFHCSVNGLDRRAGVLHKATWIHDGKPLTNVTTIATEETIVSRLHQKYLYEHLPDSASPNPDYIGGLKCSVIACGASGCADWNSTSKESNELFPNATYDLGTGNTSVTIQEGKDGVDITLTLNGPAVLFLNKDYITAKNGTTIGTNVVVEARFSARTVTPCATATTERYDIIIENTCGHKIDSTNWKEPHQLTLKAVTDGLYGDEVVTRKCDIIMKHLDTTGGTMVKKTFTNAFDVHVKSADGWGPAAQTRRWWTTCYAVNDPHLKTFDQFYYDAHVIGEFIMYRNKIYNYQINAMFTWCSHTIACVCGVAVKAGDDVVVMSSCPTSANNNPTFKIYIWQNGNFTPGLKVYHRGYSYYVYLPTGTYAVVDVWPWWPYVSLVIEPSLADLYNTEGLCGDYNGKKTGDFRNKNGTLFTKVKIDYTSWYKVDAYAEEWREDTLPCKSIFYGVPEDLNLVPVKTYCTCVLGSDSHDCGEHKDFVPCVRTGVFDVTPNGTKADKVEVKTPDLGQCTPPSSGRKKRAATYTPPVGEDDEYQSFVFETKFVPTTSSWPTASGWTEATAKKYCEDFLLTKDAVKNCKAFMGETFETEINACVFDIKVSDATDFAKATLRNIIAQCLAEAQKYPVTVTELPGGMKKTTLYDSCCLDNCNNNGVCKDALCVCNPGFYGSTCSLTKDIPPNIVYMSRNGLCNTRTRDCTTSYIFGTGHIESPDLKCRMTPYDHRTGIRDTKGQFTTSAIYHNFNMLACPHSEKNGTFLVAVSNNNGKDYSKDELLFLPYDSACHNCSSVDQDKKKANCTQEVTGCVVGSACYLDGEVDEGSICRICNTNLNINNWSVNTAYSNCTKVPEDDNIALIAGVTTAVLVVAIIIIVVLALKFCKRKKSIHPPSAADIQEEACATESASEEPVRTNGERKLSGISTGDIKPAWNL